MLTDSSKQLMFMMEMEIRFSFCSSEIHGDHLNGREIGETSLTAGLKSLNSNWTGVMQMTVYSGCVLMISNNTSNDSKYASTEMVTTSKASLFSQ
jgi:hypothetical protein